MSLLSRVFQYSRIQFATGLFITAALTQNFAWLVAYAACYLMYGWLNLDVNALLKRYGGNRRDHDEICATYKWWIDGGACMTLAGVLIAGFTVGAWLAAVVLSIGYCIVIQFIPAPNSS